MKNKFFLRNLFFDSQCFNVINYQSQQFSMSIYPYILSFT